MSDRRGGKDQECCTVYNMIRLADYLYRWTGQVQYLNYIERNLYNGILAQQNPNTGMVAYFSAMRAGGKKVWGHPTHDFWCCHGTLVQAHPMLPSLIWYRGDGQVTLAQYIPSKPSTDLAGGRVTIDQTIDMQAGETQSLHPATAAYARPASRPNTLLVRVNVECDRPTAFRLQCRVPEWAQGQAKVSLDGQPVFVPPTDGYIRIERTWTKSQLTIEFPKTLRTERLPDEPRTVAFLNGPEVLAGLVDKEYEITCDTADATGVLAPDNERSHGSWMHGWRTVGQNPNFRLRPLHEIVDEPYTIYFPMSRKRD